MTTQALSTQPPAPPAPLREPVPAQRDAQVFYAQPYAIPHDASLDTLPPKPEDLRGRHVTWAMIAGEPGVYYKQWWDEDAEWIPMDEAWFDFSIMQFNRLTAGGYKPPIREAHIAAGERKGDVLQLAKWRDPLDGRLKLICALAWAIPDVEEKIQSGALAYVSMGLSSFIDEQGQTYDRVVAEVSICDAPYHKHLSGGRDRHILKERHMPKGPRQPTPPSLSESGQQSSTNPTPPPASPARAGQQPPPATPSTTLADADALHDKITAMQQTVDSLAATVVNLSQTKTETSAPPAQPSVDAPKPQGETSEGQGGAQMGESSDARESALEARVRELEATNARLEREHARATFKASYPTGHTLTLSDTQLDLMFKLREADAETFDALAEHFRPPAANTPSPPSQGAPSGPALGNVPWGKRLGSGDGSPSEAGGVDLSDPEAVEQRKRELRQIALQQHGGDSVAARATFAKLKAEEGLTDAQLTR